MSESGRCLVLRSRLIVKRSTSAVDGSSAATENRAALETCRRLSQGVATSMQLTVTGAQGTYQIQTSPDLVHWTTLTSIALAGPPKQYSDNGIGGLRHGLPGESGDPLIMWAPREGVALGC